jgi:hypothetical protein
LRSTGTRSGAPQLQLNQRGQLVARLVQHALLQRRKACNPALVASLSGSSGLGAATVCP